MRTFFKAAIVAFGVTGALAAAPAGAQPYDPYADNGYDQGYDQAYGDPYAQDGGYCDPQYGCPDDYYDLPLYYGDVYYDGGWATGPFFYRDFGGRRQFWMHGGWHGGEFRGGRFGPALGRDFYRSHNFGGGGFNRGGNFGGGYNRGGSYGGGYNRGGNFGGQDFARRAYQPQQNFQPQPYAGSHNWNRGGFGGGGWNRQGFQGQGFQNQAVQPYQGGGGGGGWRGRFQGQAQQNGGGGGGGGGWRGHFQAQQQAAPQQPAPQQQAAPQNNGGGWHGGGGGWHHEH